MSRASVNPRLFSGYDPPPATQPAAQHEPLPPLSAQAIARRDAEEANYQRSLEAAKARLPLRPFTFWNAKLKLRSEVLARSEEEGRSALVTSTNGTSASDWRLLPVTPSNT